MRETLRHVKDVQPLGAPAQHAGRAVDGHRPVSRRTRSAHDYCVPEGRSAVIAALDDDVVPAGVVLAAQPSRTCARHRTTGSSRSSSGSAAATRRGVCGHASERSTGVFNAEYEASIDPSRMAERRTHATVANCELIRDALGAAGVGQEP